jgi:DNA primase
LDLNQQASLYYQSQLRQHPEATQLVAYLKKRGVTGEIAKKFQLGFAPPGWSSILTELGGSNGSQHLLHELGLVVTNENNKTYDRFRERLVFPIRNKRGQVVGFGGRVLDDSMPKYLNSPETPLFHKGREVYGLYEVLQAPGKNQRIILVEGYMDVIALHQYGVTNAVAGLGTAITQEHIELLFRSTAELVICLDGDTAGQKAAWRAVINALPALRSGRQLKILIIPEGEDPDSLIREEGVEKFEQRVEAATPLSEYFFESLIKEHPLEYIEGRSALLEKAKPLLDTMPAGAFSEMMKKQLARLTDTKATPPRPTAANKNNTGGKKKPSTIRHVITLLLRNPELAGEIKATSSYLTTDIPGMSVLRSVLAELSASPNLSSAMLLERFRGAEHEKTINALFSEEVLFKDENELSDFQQAIERLQQQVNNQRLDELLHKSKIMPLTQEEKQELRQLV